MTKNMRLPVVEQMDSTGVIEEWSLRASNIPGESHFAFTEIEAKDREIADCKAVADDLDAKLQRYIKTHSSLYPNSREDAWRATIRDKQQRCETLSREKAELLNNLIRNVDKHVRALDIQIKSLYDRNEPGFDDPDELPSIVRHSAANNTSRQVSLVPSRPTGGVPSAHSTGASASGATTPILQAVNQGVSRSATAHNSQLRLAQSQHSYASSAPATPAASIGIGRSQREVSAGPSVGNVPKRMPRQNSVISTSVRATPSGLARQASIGPGTPKAGPSSAVAPPAPQPSRAGSADPKMPSSGSTKGTGSRKSTVGTPTATARKRPPTSKSGLSRVKGLKMKKSPGSNAESELSDAESGSGVDEELRSRGTPRPVGVITEGPLASRGFPGSLMIGRRDGDGDVEMEDEEGNDDKKYCLCQNVSFGDMVACDNDECPFEWFHWHCVGLKSEPTGRWYCPICRENMNKGKKTK